MYFHGILSFLLRNYLYSSYESVHRSHCGKKPMLKLLKGEQEIFRCGKEWKKMIQRTLFFFYVLVKHQEITRVHNEVTKSPETWREHFCKFYTVSL